MKWIEKNLKNAPKSLRLHRQKSFSNYDNYNEKADLRRELLQEQGYICCYCMQRIKTPTPDKMKIEHWQSQVDFQELQLDYGNLLASCRGNEDSHSKDFHCDKKKSDDKIKLNPMDKNMMQQIIFGRNGQIKISDESLQIELNTILNLNADTLSAQREAVYKGVTHFLRKEFGNKKPSKALLNKAIKRWSEKREGKFEPFCQVVVYFLTKALVNAI